MLAKRLALTTLVGACLGAGAIWAQSPARTAPSIPIEQVIQRFAAAESENKIARNNYTFKQDFRVSTIGLAGNETGVYHRVSDIVFDDRGERVEKITYFPASTLQDLQLTNEDLQDLASVQPFALTREDLPKYQVDYIGKEKIDELNTYMFAVKPKKIVQGQRYFEGKIWVDDQDLQVVKAAGQAVPKVENQAFPHFEAYRENIDGRYWFPTYVYADDMLDFKQAPSIHMRMVLRFTNYRKFSTDIKISGGSAADDEPKDSSGTGAKKPEAKPTPPPERQ
jgi:hypothetical protein